MEEIPCEKRWLAACAALAGGGLCAFSFAPFASAWPLAAFAALVAALFSAGSRRAPAPLAAAFLAGAALAFAVSARAVRVLDAAAVESRSNPVEAEFDIPPSVDVRPRDGGASVSFPARIGPLPVFVRWTAADGEATPAPGERWRCAGWLDKRDAALFKRRGFWARGGRAYAVRVREAPRSGLRAAVAAARARAARALCAGRGMSAGAACLCRAMLLGERGLIPPADRKVFASAGMSHVFAVSGLHVLVVARLLGVILAVALVPLRIRIFVLAPVLWFYVAMVGAGPSAVRAASMATLCHAAPLFMRRPNPLVAWCATFAANFVLFPESLHDVGCTLSFAVMLALVMWGRVWGGGAPALDRILACAVAWAAGAPLVAAVFGRVTPAGLVANLVAVPAAAVAVCASALSVAADFAFGGGWLQAHLNAAAALAADFMSGVAGIAAAVPYGDVAVAKWTFPECAAWYAALACAFCAVRRLRAKNARFV